MDERLPERHVWLLDKKYPREQPYEPKIILGNRLLEAELRNCNIPTGVLNCYQADRARNLVEELLPETEGGRGGDGTSNNAKRHALLAALVFYLTGGPETMDAHEDIHDGTQFGYLDDYRKMDLINNEAGNRLIQRVLYTTAAEELTLRELAEHVLYYIETELYWNGELVWIDGYT